MFRHVLKRLLFSTSFAMLQFYCLKYLPVSTVNSLGNTSPIFAFFLEMLYFKVLHSHSDIVQMDTSRTCIRLLHRSLARYSASILVRSNRKQGRKYFFVPVGVAGCCLLRHDYDNDPRYSGEGQEYSQLALFVHVAHVCEQPVGQHLPLASSVLGN